MDQQGGEAHQGREGDRATEHGQLPPVHGHPLYHLAKGSPSSGIKSRHPFTCPIWPFFTKGTKQSCVLYLQGLEIANAAFCRSLQGIYTDLDRKIKFVMRLADLYRPYLFFKGMYVHTHTHKFVNRCLAFCSLKCFLCGQVRWLQHREAASRSERERRGDRHLLLRPWVHRLGGLCDEYPHPRDCQARLPTNILVVSNSYLLDYDFDSLFWYKQQAPKCYKSHNSTSISSK